MSFNYHNAKYSIQLEPKVVTVQDSYPHGVPEAPVGYEIVDFRPPVSTDEFISNGLAVNVLTNRNWPDEPRLILRKRESKVRYVEVERRYKGDWIQKGEWYQIYSDVFCADSGFQISNTATAIIFRREEF